ncbi:MAG: response regulator [Chloroflexi bacterium]|nr:response regulator [Chloroflexota bacterium]
MPTILVVDDDVNLLSSLGATLEADGHRVLRASRLDQAGRYVATEMIDVVLLEVETEHGRGWDFLRELTTLRNVPVIVASSHGLEEDIVAALDLGASDYLTKPFRTNELTARIRRRMRDPQSQRPAAPQPSAPSPAARPPVAPAPAATGYPDEEFDPDAPLFMGLADEHSLLQERTAVEAYSGNIEELPLGARLRAARQRGNLSLVQVELDTKLRIWYLQAMEETRFGMLPRGMAEQMLRTYAQYLGLNVEHTVSDYREEFADLPVQPLAYLGGKPEPREIPRWIVVGVSALLALIIGLGGLWYLVPDQVLALNDNIRTMINPPTATATPTITPPPTLTPTATTTPTATATTTPTATATATPTLQPTIDPSITATAGP